MAPNLMRPLATSVLMLLGMLPLAANSEALSDPTRPPFGINEATHAVARPSAPQVRGLQSVILSPGRCAAIIDGKTVALGAKHGSERLVEISARGVVLQGAGGRRALTLFPAVDVKITEALPQDKPLARCQIERTEDVRSPAKQMGQKERK